MGIYVNPDAGRFIIDRNDRLYVDKSELIACLNEKIDTKERFIDVTPKSWTQNQQGGHIYEAQR